MRVGHLYPVALETTATPGVDRLIETTHQTTRNSGRSLRSDGAREILRSGRMRDQPTGTDTIAVSRLPFTAVAVATDRALPVANLYGREA